MNRQAFTGFLRRLCFIGLFASLLVWMLPISLKPYHIRRWLDDYDTELIEQSSEWGFDAAGIVHVRCAHDFTGGTVGDIDRIRSHWYREIQNSPRRWPTDGQRLHYDAWGPSNWRGSDGVHEIESGEVYCLPYSFIALMCALPLSWWMIAWFWRQLRGPWIAG